MDVYNRVRALIEGPTYANDAFRLALAPTLLSYTWNSQDLYSPTELAVTDLLATTEYKGNPRRAFNYLIDRSTILDVPILAPSDTTLSRRLVKSSRPTKTFGKPIKNDVSKLRDHWAQVHLAQTNLLLEVTDASRDDFFAVLDGSPTPLFQANKARRVGEPTEVQQHRSWVVRNHGGPTGIPFYRGTFFGLPWHNASIHGFENRLSSMVYTELEQQGNILAHVERATDALLRLEQPLFSVMVDRLYTQNGQVIDLLQEQFNPVGTWIMGPMKAYSWVTDLIRRGWTDRNARLVKVNGEIKWYFCERAGWRSREAKGRLPFWILVIYEAVPDHFTDELEQNARIVQRQPGATIVGYACLVNHEVDDKSAPRLAGTSRRRWAGESFYKVPKHGLGGRSTSPYLFPRAHRTGTGWAVANSYALWRAVRQNKYQLPTDDERLGLERFRNHVRVNAERFLELRGAENEALAAVEA